jgi:hypothetical protein
VAAEIEIEMMQKRQGMNGSPEVDTSFLLGTTLTDFGIAATSCTQI